MDRLDTVLDFGSRPFKSGRYVFAHQVSPHDAGLQEQASLTRPPVPLEIVTPQGVIRVLVSSERTLNTFRLWPAPTPERR